jgi:uncharacterized membrane-anchored protein YhcB (DUF1043 family)
MATTSITTTSSGTPTSSPLTTVETTVTSWLKLHERLIIAVLLIGAGIFGFQKYADIRATDASAKVQTAQAQLVAQQAAVAQQSAQVQQTTAQYQSLVAQLSQQNAQLSTSIAQRNQALTVQQTTDKVMPLPQLATRWAADADFDASTLQTNGATLIVPQEVVADTVEKMDSIPVLQANLNDVQSELTNTKTELTSANTLIGQQKQDIAGIQQQNIDQVKADNAEIANVKAQARKSRMKWFGVGYVAGFISGLLK